MKYIPSILFFVMSVAYFLLDLSWGRWSYLSANWNKYRVGTIIGCLYQKQDEDISIPRNLFHRHRR